MPDKIQFYSQMADHAAIQAIRSYQSWTAFLETAARLYKYPYNEQIMIHAQRPDATACADYETWNERMGRYVRRGSKGIALVDTSGDNPRLKYVFDVADTNGRIGSRSVNLWKYKDEHYPAVSAVLERSYSVSADTLPDQLEQIASKLAAEYWETNQRDILDIVADSFLEEYDDFNIGVQFRNAAAVSIAYTLLFRCGLAPEEHFDHEDFLSTFDFNTPATVAALGTAVSEASQKVLRQIEVAIKNYEREMIAERTQHEHIDLPSQRGLSHSRPAPQQQRQQESGQVRTDAESVSEGAPPAAVEPADSIGEAVSAPVGDRQDGTAPDGADHAPTDAEQRHNGDDESLRADEVDGDDEQPESAGGGDHSGRADLQLSLFPTEEQQIHFIDKAESRKLPAFSFSQEQIDHVLRLGSNTNNARMIIADACQKQKSPEAIAELLQQLFRGGNGFKTDDAEYAAWYGEDGIRLAFGRSARYEPEAQLVPWADAAKRIGEMLDKGSFATNVELAEAESYARQQIAESLWYLYHDMSEDAHEVGYLGCIDELRGGGFPDETARLAEQIANPVFRERLTSQVNAFLIAYGDDRSLMRFNYHRPDQMLHKLLDLNLPRTEYHTELAELPTVYQFITEDEINEAISGGSGMEGGKLRIFEYFSQTHTTKERADFLKAEYGVGGHSHALSGASFSSEDHSAKGIRLRKENCTEVQLNWSNVAKRITELIRKDRYLTPPEHEQYKAIREAENATNDYEAEHGADSYRTFPDNAPEEIRHELSQDDIDDTLLHWNGDPESKRWMLDYMREHGRELGAAKWLADEYSAGGSDALQFPHSDVAWKWPQVQRRLLRLINDGRFPEEQKNIAEYLGERGNTLYFYAPVSFGIETDFGDVPELRDDQRMVIASPVCYHGDEFLQSHRISFLKIGRDIEEAQLKDQSPTEQITAMEQAENAFSTPEGKLYHVGDHISIGTERDGQSEIVISGVDADYVYYTFTDLPEQAPVEILRAQFDAHLDDTLFTLIQPEAPAYTTETLAFYPAEENHLPYDIEIQTLHVPEKEPPSLPPAENYRITDDDLGAGGPKAKFRMNMDAINLLKELELDGRQATPEEQTVLSRYVGWGGLADAFDESKPAWHDEYLELYAALTPEEYTAARASTLNAHYTSPTVIKAIYEAVGQMGFRTGNILEPSMGIGNFFGCLPSEMQDSRLYGVELDSITGRIAKQLYPRADITVAGYETTDRRDFFDLAIGNVPFGQYKVDDRAYNKLGFSIHDYFFAKTLDQVRPGGIIAFVTSRYTMDKQSPEVRKYIAQRAELLGAIRLPNTAFKANAGTDVVSDILFLQRRDRPIDIEPDWVQLDTNEDGFSINSYFVEHPEMILGRQSSESTQYGRQDFTVEPWEDESLADLLHAAVQNIGGEYTEAELPDLGEEEAIDNSIPADPDVKNFSYTIVDGEVYYRQNSRMVKPELNATARERVKGLVALRDCTHKLIAQQMDGFVSDYEIQQTQAELNRLYDSFTAKYGLINARGNSLAFADDSSYYLLCSLEILDEDRSLKRKADMFTKRTIKPHEVVTAVDTASEALALSISERACVDMDYMSQLTGKSEDELTAELRGVVFQLPETVLDGGGVEYVTADEYLSGNVREKLRRAEDAAALFPEVFRTNVEALRAAQPKDLDASEIEVRLGATWIDKEYIQQFMMELLKTPFYLQHRIEVNFSPYTAEWSITGKNQCSYSDVNAYINYGTTRVNGYKILEDSLNLRDVRVYDTVRDPDGKERRVLNSKETTLAQQKQQAIKDAFREWLWADADRRHALVAKYNELFNATRPRQYDGSHIHFSGINPEIQLREHQLNAVAHILYGGNTLLAHEVGAGKTFEMVAAAMESKRLGLCQKPLFAVPNHLTEQWASEFLRLYPSANILVAARKDFEPRNRKTFCGRIATGDYDAVIIGHSQFEKIPVSLERQERLIEEQIQEIEDGIAELKASRAERFTIKDMEKTKRSLEVKLKKLQSTERKDDVVTFEQLGVDRLYVDEAHGYKNLFLYTKMRNVAGLSTSDAQKSSDMFLKCRYIDEITDSKGIVFATGTPVSNSMTELYTMMRYLEHDLLHQKGLAHFDAWASTFGETTTAIELAPEGTGYRARTRFAKFFNLPELMNLFKQAADIKTADQLDLPTPTPIYHNVVAQPTEIQKGMVQQLSERAARVHAGTVDASIDNMLKITSDGRKLGLDQRIINADLPDDPNSKVNQCVENIFTIWRDGQADKLTQLVFCDISTPKTKTADKTSGRTGNTELHAVETMLDKELPREEATFTVYDDIRDKLIARGVPPEQIAFIHDANTEVRKKELFAKVRSGQVRVLMGSTFKMGAGMNVQDRLVALHDLDCPWRPGDLEQRSGRIIRQGNRNKEVHIFRYVTEATFDAYLWQTVENKQKFISQIMTSKSPVRSCEDVDETALSYAEIKALCAGDDRIREKMDLDVDVARLKLMKANHQSQQFRLEDQLLKTFPEKIEQYKGFIRGFEADMKTLTAHPHPTDGFAGMTVRGDHLTDKENAGAALLDAMKDVKSLEPVPVGHYRGFDMSLTLEDFGHEYILTLKAQMTHRVTLGKDARGNLTRIDNVLDGMPTRLNDVQQKLDDTLAQMEAARQELGKPFPQEEELQTKSARLAELNAELNIDERSPMEQLAEEDAPVVAKAEPKASLLAQLHEVRPETAEKRPNHHSFEEVR